MSILGARGPDDTRPAIIVVPFFLTLMATITLYYRKRLLAMPGWIVYGTLMSAMFFLIILGKSVRKCMDESWATARPDLNFCFS
jgi:hypothetical protein